MHAIEQLVLKSVTPKKTEREHIERIIKNLVRHAEAISACEAVVVGSIGKDTWLQGNHDIDLFLLFSQGTSREDLEKKGLFYGKKIAQKFRTKPITKYAEHPYTRIRINGFDVDIVPCYKIPEGHAIQSAVDRSPMHLKYVVQHLSEKQKNDVRLLKQFCKGIGVYGSDAKNHGVSGYLCELLVIHYHSFANVIKKVAAWKPPVIVGSGSKKFSDPLVVIDPTDQNRNVAAVMSPKNLIKYIHAARAYQKKPEKTYFVENNSTQIAARDIARIKNRKTQFILLKAKRPALVDDNLYPQLRKMQKRLHKHLLHHEFVVIRSGFHIEKEILLFFECEVWQLPQIQKMVGPPITDSENADNFLGKYHAPLFGPYIENETWVIEKKRMHENVGDICRALKKQSVQSLVAFGIPKDLASPIKQAKYLEGSRFWGEVKKNKELKKLLYKEYVEHVVYAR